MTNRQLRRYEMLFRVLEFGAAHRERFPESSRAGRAFAIVANAVTQLRDRAVAQLALKREGALARREARAALVEMLESISRTAATIREDESGFPNSFHLPERSAQGVLTAARLGALHLEPVAAQFIDHGMPETLVADFKRLFETYEQAFNRREIGKGESAAARASIDATIESALVAARRLDVIVANRLRGDSAAIANWERSRRVPYAKRDQAPTTAPVDSSPAPEVSPPAVPKAPPVAAPTVGPIAGDTATPAVTPSMPPVVDDEAA